MSTLINATLAAIVYLYYIGSKPKKTDTVTDTKITWNGFGDKQPVPADKASILIGSHPDVWVTEDEFNKGVEEGRYKPRELSSQSMQTDDIELDYDSISESDLDNPMDDDDESNDASVEEASVDEIVTMLLSIDISEKPKISDLRAAYSAQGGTKRISTKALNAAWASLKK